MARMYLIIYFYFSIQNNSSILFRIEKFTMVGVDVKGILVCDKNGLTLTSNSI